MTTVAPVLAEIRDLLQDTDQTLYRWADAQLLRHLTSALRVIVALRPECNTVEALHAVDDTNPRRVIESPTQAVSLVHVECNVNADGSHGQAIKRVLMHLLEAIDPNWRATVGTGTDPGTYYDCYVFDPREPDVFWLYPRPHVGFDVFITYVQDCGPLTSSNDTLPLDDVYINAIIEWVLFRALSTEGRYARPSDIAKMHLDNFASLLKLSENEYRSLVRRSSMMEQPP